MGLIGSIKGLPVLILVSLILLFLANILNGIAFSTTAWGESYVYFANTLLINPTSSYLNFGLWRSCSGSQLNYALFSTGTCSEAFTGTAAGWMAATQALACFGLVGIILGFVLILVFVMGKNDSDYLLVAAIVCLVTGVMYLIGVIIYGYHFMATPFTITVGLNLIRDRRLGWSYGLAIVSIIFELVAGVLLIVGRMKARTSPA